MKQEDLKSRLTELYLPPTDRFVFVDVPKMPFVMIDGEGDSPEHKRHAAKWLFTVVHPIKLIAKERMGKDFVEAPLEGLWWADDMADFVRGDRDKMRWRMMIVMPDWATKAMFKQGVEAAKEKLGEVPDSLRLERYDEGRSAQFTHVGPPAEAAPRIARMHNEFLPEHGLVPNGYHHEIYLNDPSRVAPEKLKTVFRQPVRAEG
jgi:hypothetical protein